MHIIMATPLYNNNTDPIIIPDNLLFYHIPTWQLQASGSTGRARQTTLLGCDLYIYSGPQHVSAI
jgi:hypothetical protein